MKMKFSSPGVGSFKKKRLIVTVKELSSCSSKSLLFNQKENGEQFMYRSKEGRKRLTFNR